MPPQISLSSPPQHPHSISRMWNIIIFEDIFVVDQFDPDGKKFDKGEKFTMALAHTLNMDGTPDTGYYAQGERKSLADKYEYIMHGKLYKISDESSGKLLKAEVYVSFGGLLMLLRGEPSLSLTLNLTKDYFSLLGSYETLF